MELAARRASFVLVLALVAAGCSSPGGGSDVPAGDAASDASVPADGPVACTGIGTCGADQECIAGASGCGMPAVCVPASTTLCSRTSEPFCGCDGVTFNARGGCPDRPFAYRGECVDAGMRDAP